MNEDFRDFRESDRVVQIGVRPRRIDILTDLRGVEFEAAWADRVMIRLDDMELPFIGRDTLVRNKRATGRLRDRADVESLRELEPDDRAPTRPISCV